MAKNNCILVPEIDGEASQLYIDLERRIKNKPLTNLIYAHYSSLGVGAQMDSQGFVRNKQGQHSAKDVYEFLGVGNMVTEATDIYTAKREASSIDPSGNTIKYSDAMQALNLARDFNSRHTGTVASVTQHGDYFEILVNRKDSRTQVRSAEVEKQIEIWNTLEQAFRAQGIELSSLDFARSTVNPINATQFLDYLGNIASLNPSSWDLLTKRDLQILFTINENSTQVQRLKQKFGTIEEVAQKVTDMYRGSTTVTTGERALIDEAIKDSMRLGGLNLKDIKATIAQQTQDFDSTSEVVTIQDEIKTLDKRYGINAMEIHSIGDSIDSLSEAATQAAFTIQRQIRQLENQRGTTTEGERLEKTLRMLMNELKSNHFYLGTLNFLKEATTQIQNIDTILNNIPTNGTNMENSINSAKALMEIKSIMDGYYRIIDALSNIDALIIDENISDYDKQVLESQAKPLKEFMERKESVLRGLRKSVMLNVATEVLGNSLPTGTAIADIIEIQEKDCSILDHLYSVGRISDPMIGAMGKVIRDAQDSRDKKMADIALRIRRATHALYKSGSNSEFMYDSDNRIISDIDWHTYFEERAKAIKSFRKQGKRGFELKDAVEQWEEANTEDRVVDMVSGRSERVPNSSYRKEFPKLTRAQQEYYNTMMQLKGELGTLLPQFAQQQYRPPQLRRSFIDAINHAKNAKDVAKAIWNKISNIWKIREDDTDFVKRNRAVIEGQDYNISEGDFNRNPLQSIPIFFINKIEDQGELMKDFSGALQALASTAINYDAMSKVQDLVELMGDYIKNERKPRATRKGDSLVDAIQGWGINVYQDLIKKSSNSNTTAIVDSFINQHLYGQKFADEDKAALAKAIKNIVGYTSVKNLALNLKGMISNFTVGELSMIIEAGAGEFYGVKDYLWAHKMLFGGPTEAGRIMGMMLNDRNSKEYLLSVLFDPTNDSFGKSSSERYHRNVFRQLLHGDFTFLGYGAGEYLIHYINMYAMLHHEKVTVDGKKMSLYKAFTVDKKSEGNSELHLKGTEVKDKDGNIVDQAWLEDFRRRVRYVNQNTHGSMNEEDKGIFHQRILGKLAMNFRQWMVEHYSRRYRKEHYDASSNDWREGYWRTYMRFMGSWVKGLVTFNTRAAIHWNTMTNKQRANVKRCLTEHMLLASLWCLSMALGEPDDHKREFWYRMWIYQTKRMLLDVHASTPTGAILEAKTMINSPVPSINTFNGFLYPFLGWRDLNRTLRSGPNAGENAYWRNVKKYTLPFWKDINQIQNMDEDESIFSIFEPERAYR